MKSEATHSAKAVYYKSCGTCGYKGTATFENGEVVPHTTSTTWSKDDNNHWHTCTTAGCESVKLDEAEHVYNQEVATSDYIKSEATCLSDAIYYKSCVCGQKGSETFAKAETKLDHDYDLTTWGYKAAEGHAHVCKTEGCDAHDTVLDHDLDAVDVCNDCDYNDHEHVWTKTLTVGAETHYYVCTNTSCTARNEEDDHAYNEEVSTEAYFNTAATCEEAATYFKSCVCGAKGTETFVSGEAKGHDDSGDWLADTENENHYKLCATDGCGTKILEGSHTGGTALCNDKANCTICNKEYGDLADHNWSTEYSNDGLYHWYKCTTDGCEECNEKSIHVSSETDSTLCKDCGSTISAAEYSHEFASGDLSLDSSKVTLNNVEWNTSYIFQTETTYFSYSNSQYQIGKNNAGVSTITFDADIAGLVSSAELQVGSASSGEATVSLYINDVLVDTLNITNGTPCKYYRFELAEPKAGNFKFVVTQNAAKATYVKGIYINPAIHSTISVTVAEATEILNGYSVGQNSYDLYSLTGKIDISGSTVKITDSTGSLTLYGVKDLHQDDTLTATGTLYKYSNSNIQLSNVVVSNYVAATYDVSISSSENGTITLTNNTDSLNNIAYGTELSFTITPNSGYALEKLIVNDTDVSTTVTDGVFSIVVTSNVTISATYRDANVAVETVVATCDFTTKSTGNTAYTGSWQYNTDWTVYGGANNNAGWDYVKMGGKSSNLTNANPVYIQSSQISQSITKVTVNIIDGSLSKSGMSVTSWGLYVYSDAECTQQVDYVAGDTITNSAGTFEFVPTNGTSWDSNYYYKVSFDLVNSSSTNGIIYISDIDFYAIV